MATCIEDLKCGICLELFQDPRSLPCLHTFCRECIQRSLNEENHSLKCPVCRAKHELSERAELLPVNQYALQELPLKRLQQQREDNGGPHQLVECKSCGEHAGPVVAWCEDCDSVISQHCFDQHNKLVIFRRHHVVKNNDSRSPNVPERNESKSSLVTCCMRHVRAELKYWCTVCSEVVCAEFLLGPHKDHDYSLAEEAHHNLESKIKDMAGLVVEKKQEFSAYLDKARMVEGKALEYSERMKGGVNNVFDGIAASVEAQRNEALQSVSQGVKEIWSQKEMMEVSLAQLDSFTRFADHTHKCTTSTRYVAMATQGIKLMERLKDTHGDEAVLEHKGMVIATHDDTKALCVPLNSLFAFGQPSLRFYPSSGAKISKRTDSTVSVEVSLQFKTSGFSQFFPSLTHICETGKLNVTAAYCNENVSTEIRINQSSWKITVNLRRTFVNYFPLVIECKLSGAVSIADKITYKA